MTTLKTKIVMGWLAIALGLAVVALEACSSPEPSSSSPTDDAGRQGCIPGQQTTCACAGGGNGFQVCDPSGASGACQCSSEVDDAASSADTGGSDAGANDTGVSDATVGDTGTSDTGTGDTGADAAVPIPTTGLVAYYRGDGVDKSGNANNLTGGMTLTPDRFGGAQAGKIVSSADGYLMIATHPLIPTGNQAFSISVWARRSGAAVPVLNWGSESGSSIAFGDILAAGNGTNSIEATVPEVVLGTWHHFVLTFDGSNTSLFVDDSLAASKQISIGSGAGFFVMGNRCGINFPAPPPCAATGGQDLGSIDDVRVYNRVLTQPEIDALYHEAK